jgi:hypothetical protein
LCNKFLTSHAFPGNHFVDIYLGYIPTLDFPREHNAIEKITNLQQDIEAKKYPISELTFGVELGKPFPLVTASQYPTYSRSYLLTPNRTKFPNQTRKLLLLAE